MEASQSTDAGLLWSFKRGLVSALTAATLALALLFCSSPTAYAAAFPFAPRVSSSPATLEMKVHQQTGLRGFEFAVSGQSCVYVSRHETGSASGPFRGRVQGMMLLDSLECA